MTLCLTSTLFKQVLDERQYLKNVTTSTLEWYDTAFKAFERIVGRDEPLTKSNTQRFVIALRERGLERQPPAGVDTESTWAVRPGCPPCSARSEKRPTSGVGVLFFENE